MLSEKEVASLTLRAPYIHEHGDRPYFMNEVNTVAQQLKEPSHLNYFIRYRSERADASKHRWSRVTRVIFLEDCRRSAHSNGVDDHLVAARGGAPTARPTLTIQTAPSDQSPVDIDLHVDGSGSHHRNGSTAAGKKTGGSVVWHNKLFWIAFMVLGEEEPVYLPRVSRKLPSEEEVMQFCAYQSITNPSETFSSVPPQNSSITGAAETKDRDGESGTAPAVDATALARTYLPTAEQIKKLRDFREDKITRHIWTVEETEEARLLHAKYGERSTGAAAAPMAATINKVRNLQLESRLLNQQPQSLPSTQQLQPHDSGLLHSESLPQSPGLPSQQPQQTAKRNLRGHSVYTGRSPFLPKRLRQRSTSSGTASAMQTPNSTQMDWMETEGRSQQSLGGGARVSASAFDDATPSSQLMPPQQQRSSQSLIDADTVESWEEGYSQQLDFYRYITDGQRSGYINKIADITRRNALQNRINRLAGIEFEKKMERQANFVESGGLWVTDDKLRAEKAAQYKAAQESESGGKKEAKADKPAAAATATGAAEAGGSDSKNDKNNKADVDPKESIEAAEKRRQENRLLEVFRQKHAVQDIRVDSVPDDWLNDEFLFSDATAATAMGVEGDSASHSPSMSSSVTASPSPYRLLIPRLGGVGGDAGKANSNGKQSLDAPSVSLSPAAAAQRITSQLLHRSAANMALGYNNIGSSPRATEPTGAEPPTKKTRMA